MPIFISHLAPHLADGHTEEEDRSLSSTSSDDDEEGDNPYSSYQQFHKELSSHDDPPPVADKHGGDSTTQDDPKSELIEFETLEQGELIIKDMMSATQQNTHRHSPTIQDLLVIFGLLDFQILFNNALLNFL